MRVSTLAYLSFAGVATASSIIKAGEPVRMPLYTRDLSEKERADAVIEGFRHAWSGYKEYAFPADELKPVSNTKGNSRNGWGASAVDAWSTAIVMGQQDISDTILQYIPTIDFTTTATEVSLFETTIRYLAGMLAGYDLLKGPASALNSDPEALEKVLGQAKTLGDTLKFAFNTTSGVPYNGLNITAQTPTAGSEETNGLATVGTLILEWLRLSDLTGEEEYGKLAAKAEEYLLNPKPDWAEPFPGLVGTNINITTGEFLDAQGGWNGGDDSFYEYLIKMYVYDPESFGTYKDRWVAAADSSIQYLASSPSSRKDLTYLAAFTNTSLDLQSGHLACFDGGNFLLGGAVLGEQKYTDFGLKLTEACRNTYNSTASKIGPEGFAWDTDGVPAGQKDFFEENGFYITSFGYDLRPEVIESYYYSYRMTGDTKYQDWAWEAFVAINATTRTESGFTNVNNVTAVDGGAKGDNQESFLFAEVLKYSYLIHAEDAEYQVAKDNSNKFVFNTEAHPFAVKGSGGY